MSSYKKFAKVYDEFMSDIPYEEWAKLIMEYMSNRGKKECEVLELGCGTGTFAKLLHVGGYKVTGLDNSETMIARARRQHKAIDFRLADMRCFETDKKYEVIVSVCDSMNYMSDELDLEAVMECVDKVLDEDGIFLFDMKTEAFYKSLGDNVYTDENESGNYIWENEYDKENRDNYYFMTFFVKNILGIYNKYNEEHVQHAFTKQEVIDAAAKHGLVVTEVFGMDMKNAADFDAERVYYIVERNR